MINALSPTEITEEEFLKHASTNQLCAWLLENADSGVTERKDHFQSLREKYEPIWSKSEDKLLKLSVCRYGRNIKNLKRLLFSKTLPDAHAFAILGNSALMRDGGIFEFLDYFRPSDVVKLYQVKTAEKKDYFFHLFQSDSIKESFLLDLFNRERPYHTISDGDLFRVLCILFNHKRKYFSERSENYTKHHRKDEARNLANAIVKFIWRSKEKVDHMYDASRNIFAADIIYDFIEDSMSLGSNGIPDIRTLMSFQPSELLNDRDRHEIGEKLAFIRFHLGNRAYASVILTAQETAICELLRSDIGEVRSIFYRNAPLHLIYSASKWQCERFFKEMAQGSSVNILYGDTSSFELVSDESRKILEEISRYFERDKAGFAVSLALNRHHYTSKNARDFLSALCSYGDHLGPSFGVTLQDPFGFSTCSDLFEQTREEIRRESPGYFEDDTLEARLLQKIDTLSAEVERLKTLMIEYKQRM
jgi:hypothetical protein